MTREEWLMMGEHMGGIAAMGGPAIGLLPRAPADTSRAAPQHRHEP
jgi:hypothetical protein